MTLADEKHGFRTEGSIPRRLQGEALMPTLWSRPAALKRYHGVFAAYLIR